VTARWTLERAGIVNVYQYGHETLAFAGGRLLLRGVNGSGKSTAMNMLLPFLLDGDTRRIDAAGEQAGVLKSWMLSGRDDQQPIGYLWVEFSRRAAGGGHSAGPAEYVACGCGIKANRSTDAVNTWWFVTSRRPDIDFTLVEDRRPLSAESLRVVLGADPVYRHDQRAAYRGEVRRRLFGGADLDQHIRLLHVVRNPRVGDRIDVDLPMYLNDALPQLSEAALEDAAQPLDDLEEHRHNVEELQRTADALGALGTVYSSYARTELRRRATEARAAVRDAERAQRERRHSDLRVAQAGELISRAADAIMRLDADERRIRSELQALGDSPAYRQGQELNELRDRVNDLAGAVVRATEQLASRTSALTSARADLEAGVGIAEDDWAALFDKVGELATVIAGAGLACTAPPLPTIVTDPEDANLPATLLAGEPFDRGLQGILLATRLRRDEVRQLEGLLDAVDAAERLVAGAAEARDEALREAEERAVVRDAARRALEQVVTSWRRQLASWLEVLAQHLDEHRVTTTFEGPNIETDLITRRDEVVGSLGQLAGAAVAFHERAVARLTERRNAGRQAVDETNRLLSELEATILPRPPTLYWQSDGRLEGPADLRRPAFSELVDFHPLVPAAARAGLEAALEAAGLLAAEVLADGGLTLASGELFVGAGRPVPEALSTYLTVTVAEEHAGLVAPEAVARVLDGISVDPADLDGPDESTVVTTDGRFRIGHLQGRHDKPEAEHVGHVARRAALERSRAEARAHRDAAVAELVAVEEDLARAVGGADEASRIRAGIPAAAPVAEALVAVRLAEDEATRMSEKAARCQEALERAEGSHAAAIDTSRRSAANSSLPADRGQLGEVAERLEDTVRLVDQAGNLARALERSVRAWDAAGRRWRQAAEDEQEAGRDHDAAVADHAAAATRLVTLEDAMGADYEEVVGKVAAAAQSLTSTSEALKEARDLHGRRQAELAVAQKEAETAAERLEHSSKLAVAHLERLRQTIQVPGLFEAASPVRTALPPVDETPEGVGVLAAALLRLVAEPERPDVTAESVRQSLRQRRDTLGAGWDAEDRQADETLPVAIEVNGPEGRMPLARAIGFVGGRLAENLALLTSEQEGALRNLLQGLVAHEVSEKMHAASELVDRVNARLDSVTTSHGIGVGLRWRRRRDLEPEVAEMVDLLAKPPDLRTPDQDGALRGALSARLDEARRDSPEAPYRDLIGQVLDYRGWHELTVLVRRPGHGDERLTRRTALSEGEKKIVSYLPLFAAVAASYDSLAEVAPDAPRFVLLDDAFAKVSEDNHPKLFGLLVELDLDFVATSERLWGTHATVPELAITEVLRDADLGVIVLEHSLWDGAVRTELS